MYAYNYCLSRQFTWLLSGRRLVKHSLCHLLQCRSPTEMLIRKMFDVIFIHDEKLITKVLASNFLFFGFLGSAAAAFSNSIKCKQAFFYSRSSFTCEYEACQCEMIHSQRATNVRPCTTHKMHSFFSLLLLSFWLVLKCKQEHWNIKQIVIHIKDHYWWTAEMYGHTVPCHQTNIHIQFYGCAKWIFKHFHYAHCLLWR